MSITTTGNIRVQDVTFKKARRQCEIEKELGIEAEKKESVEIPNSFTVEQMITYCQNVINLTTETRTKVYYGQMIRYLRELEELRKYKMQKEREVEKELAGRDNIPDDIQQ